MLTRRVSKHEKHDGSTIIANSARNPAHATLYTRLVLLVVLGTALVEPWFRENLEPQCWVIKHHTYDITPKEPVFQAGFASRTRPPTADDGVQSPLQASVLVLAEKARPELPLVWIALDLIGMGAERATRIRTHVAQVYRVPQDRVILSFSHTHSGPVVEANLRPLFLGDPRNATVTEAVNRYAHQLEADLSEAALIAQGSVWQSVSARYSVGTWDGGVNRRTNNEREFIAGSTRAGPVDHTVHCLSFWNMRNLEFVLFGYAAHPTVLTTSYAYSSDYPGSVRSALLKMAPKAKSMFLNGCAGDINIYPRGDEEKLRRHGQGLARAVSEGTRSESIALGGSLEVRQVQFPLMYKRPNTYRSLKVRLVNTASKYDRVMLQDLLVRSRESLRAYENYSISALQIGELRMVLLAGEPVVDYSLRIQTLLSSSKENPVWVSGYTNDVCGYIPSRRVALEGGYEAGERSAGLYGHPEPFAVETQQTIEEMVQRLTDGVKV